MDAANVLAVLLLEFAGSAYRMEIQLENLVKNVACVSMAADSVKQLLIIKTGLGLGGIERSLVEFLRGLDYERYQVDLLLLYGPFNLLGEISSKVRVINAEQEAPRIRRHLVYVFHYGLSMCCKLAGYQSGFRYFKKRKLDFYYRKLYLRRCRKTYDVEGG